MKNTLKIMGLALLAGSLMLAACKKDDEEQAPVATVVVTFDGAQQPMNAFQGASTTEEFMFDAAKEFKGEDAVLPYVFHVFNNQGETVKGLKWCTYDLEFAENEYVMYDSLEWADWAIDPEADEDFDVSEFDANTLMLSYSDKATMASMKDMVDGIDPDSCRRAPLTMNIENVTFVLDQTKAKFHKRNIAK